MKLRKIFGKTTAKPSAPAAEKGVMNPVSADIHIKDGSLSFQCPTCISMFSINIAEIAPVIGNFVHCSICGNYSHVPGSFRTQTNPSNLDITGGVLVPIREFTEWFSAHPVVASLKKSGKRELFYDYGLWAFCPKCGFQYSPTVLAYRLSFLKLSQNAAGFGLNTSHPGSGREVKALLANHCPRRSSKTLNGIVANIPQSVRDIAVKDRRE